MNRIFEDYIDDFLVIFLNDLLIFSKDPKEHAKHMKIVFQKLRENSLYLKPKKCKLGVERLNWLGHTIY